MFARDWLLRVRGTNTIFYIADFRLSQGEVTVRLKEDGIVALGKGVDPDIITASALVYINGLNRLEYMKAHPPIESSPL